MRFGMHGWRRADLNALILSVDCPAMDSVVRSIARLILRPMRAPRLLLLTALFFSRLTLPAASENLPATGWPEITRENKPWTRWWWPGSAVDKASLTQQLEKIA